MFSHPPGETTGARPFHAPNDLRRSDAQTLSEPEEGSQGGTRKATFQHPDKGPIKPGLASEHLL
jgi:hypothetical protein